MTTEHRQLMREMSEGFRFKKRMTNLLKSRHCLECGDELLQRESELCERCADREIQEEMRVREAIKMFCDYYGCPNEAKVDPDLKEGMQFCEEHDGQFTAIVKANNVKAIIGFWVKAQGGAERAAKRLMGEQV